MVRRGYTARPAADSAAGVLRRAGVQAAWSKHASAVIRQERAGMVNSMADSVGVNQSHRTRMLPRVDFHAADRANMLNSAGVDPAKVQDSAGILAGRCKSMVH